jgi:hypothetical protein
MLATLIILFNNQMYQAAQTVQYTATAGKLGVAKLEAELK